MKVPTSHVTIAHSSRPSHRSVTRSYYRGAAGALIVYDLTEYVSRDDVSSFDNDNDDHNHNDNNDTVETHLTISQNGAMMLDL